MTACWASRSRLTYLWRNMNISTIFYFSKSLSINTQNSSLWDTLKMMLFTKYFIKWKRIGRISWKFWHWFNLRSSILELDIKRYLSNAPFLSAASPRLLSTFKATALLFQLAVATVLLWKWAIRQTITIYTTCMMITYSKVLPFSLSSHTNFFIFRFNLAPTLGYEKDVGNKTNLTTMNPTVYNVL